MSEPSNLKSDPLFGGLTRPATLMGLPIEILVIISGTSVIAFLICFMFDADVFWKLFCLGLGGVAYAIARLICVRDPRAFRYLALALDTKALHRSRPKWGCGSYSPMPFRKRR
ncbi:MAG: VirB3 family type IV secretion system protein [Nitrospira sp.]|nr:VirB3 family type IV secretion system protein [Nitrospira sp.]MBS0194371.1 VirB3 family type IV secretion system protein [Pseudomonadota bacterium]